MALLDFWLFPLLVPPSFVLNFTFKFVWLAYTVDNVQPEKFQTIWRVSGNVSDDIHEPMLGLVGLIIANQSSLQRKITMQERHLRWPLLFSLAPQCPHFFHSRIATVTPVGHPLTRLIHISPSCWTIYRFVWNNSRNEIILGTAHWIELLIQCFIQIHCFKKHSVRYELCFKKYF